MELPCVVLRTKDRDYFLCIDGYGGVINSELETLLQQSREVVLSLEKELEQRQVTTDLASPKGISECCEKIQKSVASLKVLERLDDRATKLITAAVETMTTQQTVHASKVYQMFLHDILRHCGRGLVLLCAASLGRQRVIKLNSRDRTQLVHYIKNHKTTLDSSTLDSLATNFEIPHDNGMLCCPCLMYGGYN